MIDGFVATNTGLPVIIFKADSGNRATVYGTAEGRRWVAWSGPRPSGATWFADPLAPLGVDATYTLGATDRVVLRRRGGVGDMLTRSDGRSPVHFVWRGDDSIEHHPGLSSMSTANGMADRWPLVPQPVTVSVELETTGADTSRMRAYATVRDQLLLMHDRTLCQVEGCDVPPVRRIVIESASEERTEHRDRARRRWTLKVLDRSADDARVVDRRGQAVVTWGEWQKLDGHFVHGSVVDIARRLGYVGEGF